MQRDGYPLEWLQELKDKNNIVEVISRYVPLQQKSNIFWGSCPFHHEKTPSFAVYEAGNYHCYGCGASGDVIKFIMEIESISFPEAVNHLAERAGMHLPNMVDIVKVKEAKKKRDRLFEILSETAKHYYQNLVSEKGQAARDYLLNRGINGSLMVRFGLGYSTDYDDVINYLKKKGFTEEEIIDSGVGWTSNKSKGAFDALAGRMIVPIIDGMGRVIAFGGRKINSEQKGGKYLNSHNTSLFVKNKALYGVNFVKKEKQAVGIDRIIIVEGYMDVISLARFGFNNAVAGMGTALGKGQARELKNLNENVYVCYDGDNAGKKAAIANLELLNDEGINLYVVTLPNGLDPDDTVKKYGADGFKKLLDEALPYVEYRLKIIEDSYNLSTASGRAKYVTDALDFLRTISDKTQQEVYLQIVNAKSRVGVNILRESLAREVAVTVFEPQSTEVIATAKSAELIAARFILNSLLTDSKFADINDISIELFDDETHKKVYEYIKEENNCGRKPVLHMLYTIASSDEEAANIVNTVTEYSEEAKVVKFYQDSVKFLKTNYINAKIKELSQRFDNANGDDRKQIMGELMDCQNKLKQLTME